MDLFATLVLGIPLVVKKFTEIVHSVNWFGFYKTSKSFVNST